MTPQRHSPATSVTPVVSFPATSNSTMSLGNLRALLASGQPHICAVEGQGSEAVVALGYDHDRNSYTVLEANGAVSQIASGEFDTAFVLAGNRATPLAA